MTKLLPGARVVDLHAHTTASDGQHPPAELVRQAAEIGLRVLAVTDHDTTAGVREAVGAGRRLDVEVVPGIELSAEPPRTQSGRRAQCHILGLFVDPDSAPLLDRLRQVIVDRNLRNDRIVERMRDELGFDVTLDEVRSAAGGDVVARPHFARILLDKGYVSSMKEAFDVYLGTGGKAYVERDRLTAEEAIALIHQSGGVAVLAHPNNLGMADPELEAYACALRAAGLDGIEARYNLHTAADTARYLALAERLSLATAGGSDYHGAAVKPKVRLGEVERGQPAPFGLVSELLARRS